MMIGFPVTPHLLTPFPPTHLPQTYTITQTAPSGMFKALRYLEELSRLVVRTCSLSSPPQRVSRPRGSGIQQDLQQCKSLEVSVSPPNSLASHTAPDELWLPSSPQKATLSFTREGNVSKRPAQWHACIATLLATAVLIQVSHVARTAIAL